MRIVPATSVPESAAVRASWALPGAASQVMAESVHPNGAM